MGLRDVFSGLQDFDCTQMSKIDPLTLSKIAKLGCCVCRKIGYPGTPAELHIFKIKISNDSSQQKEIILPMCPFTIGELIEDTNNLVGEN